MMRRSTVCRLVTALLAATAPGAWAVSVGDDLVVDYLGAKDVAVVMPLWPEDGRNPGDVREAVTESVGDSKWGGKVIRGVSQSSLVVIPARPDGPAANVTVVYAPGGGYGALGVYREPAAWAAAVGAEFAYLKYSVPVAATKAGRRLPLADAQRAVRLLRARAKANGVENHKVVVMGVSAGGHLSVSLANNHSEILYQPIDDADQLAARPDAVIGLAAAYLTDEHLNLNEAKRDRTAPVFLAITRPDGFVPGNLACLAQLRQAKVPAELHVYPHGSHASGFSDYPTQGFIAEAGRFLKDQGIFAESAVSASTDWVSARIAERVTFSLPKGAVAKAAYEGLPKSEWSEGDRRLAALSEAEQPRAVPVGVVALWPGDGRRIDDPKAAGPEKMVERADGRLRIGEVTRPTLHVWSPAKPDGRAVVICPGGGYSYLAAEHEGSEIADWLNGQGITAFILKYRAPKRQIGKHLAALQDAQRALRLVRTRHAEFGLDPQQVGIMGFSAGGNLAALAVHYAGTETYAPMDAVDAASARPDFAVLVYPAYLTKSKNSAEMADGFPALKKADYPPIFCTAAADDPYALGAVSYLAHLHQQKVPGELHVYASGGHGKGIHQRGYPFSEWAKACERWLHDQQTNTTHVWFDKAQ